MTTNKAFRTLKNPTVRLWQTKDEVIYKVEIRDPEFMAYLNPSPQEYVRLQKIYENIPKIIKDFTEECEGSTYDHTKSEALKDVLSQWLPYKIQEIEHMEES